MAFQHLGEPGDHDEPKEFNQIHAPAEGCVIDRLQALHPHMFNIWKTSVCMHARPVPSNPTDFTSL